MSAPPNWYPDPAVPTQSRWWDGARWTDAVAPAASRPAAAKARTWVIPVVVGALVIVIVAVVVLLLIGTALAPLLSDFFGTWQGVYCGETQSCG